MHSDGGGLLLEVVGDSSLCNQKVRALMRQVPHQFARVARPSFLLLGLQVSNALGEILAIRMFGIASFLNG